MTAITDKIIRPVQEWYSTSTIREFSVWWVGELKALVPANYQQQLFNRTRRLYLTKDDGSVNLWWQREQQIEAFEPETPELEKDWWHQVNHAQAAEELDTEVVHLLKEGDCLIRSIAMPTAAIGDLDSVLTYEMDKYVPYPSNEVCFAYLLERNDEEMEKTPVTLVAVHKKIIDRLYKEVSSKGIKLNAIDVNIGTHNEPLALGVNLLDEKLRKRKDWSRLRMNLILALAAIALLALVMYSSISNKTGQIEALTAEVELLKGKARTAKELESRLKDSILAAEFLSTKRQNSPQVLSMIAALTSNIPEDSYLTRILVNDERIELVGQSDNANALVPILNKSNQWNTPEVSGQIVPDPRTGKEKFTIKADLKVEQQEGEDAAV